MPHVSYESAVNAPLETAWKLIVEKTEHPERFFVAGLIHDLSPCEGQAALKGFDAPVGFLRLRP